MDCEELAFVSEKAAKQLDNIINSKRTKTHAINEMFDFINGNIEKHLEIISEILQNMFGSNDLNNLLNLINKPKNKDKLMQIKHFFEELSRRIGALV